MSDELKQFNNKFLRMLFAFESTLCISFARLFWGFDTFTAGKCETYLLMAKLPHDWSTPSVDLSPNISIKMDLGGTED